VIVPHGGNSCIATIRKLAQALEALEVDPAELVDD
jgi:hypothetical protein